MNLDDVMDEVAGRLDTITGLRVHAHPQKSVTPPVGFVTYPDSIDFDKTYGRGMDRMELGVWIAVGDANSRSARDELAAYVAGGGAKSVKAVLESGTYTAFDEVTVTRVEFDPVTIAGIQYMGAMFTLDIAGQGA